MIQTRSIGWLIILTALSLSACANRQQITARQTVELFTGNTGAVESFLASGMNPNARNGDGYTVLIFVAGGGSTDTAKLLIDKGADVNARTNSGQTALMAAASRGRTDMVKLLLDRGADINAKNPSGWTALIYGADSGKTEVVKLLLKKGADVNAKTLDGKTAFELAQLSGHTDVLDVLLKTNKTYQAKIHMGDEAVEVGKGREALTDYTAALKNLPFGSDADYRLREKIIKVALLLDPPPAFPEEAQRHVVVGSSLYKKAKNPEDYEKARSHYEEAARLVPWAADLYFNLGTVSDKLGDYAGAVRFYKLYLLAAPNTEDAWDVQNMIYVLEEKAGISSGTKGR